MVTHFPYETSRARARARLTGFVIVVTEPGQAPVMLNLHSPPWIGRAAANRPPPSPMYLYSALSLRWALPRARAAHPNATVEAREYRP